MLVDDVTVMTLRRDDRCGCGTDLPKGTKAGWHRAQRVVLCLGCLEAASEVKAATRVDIGTPGASLDREYARRMAARDLRVRARFPRIGGLLLRLAPVAPTTTAWATGADGEREVAEQLQRALGDSALFLFNRRRGTGRERGDIDMIVIAASGVWIIDPKKYVNKRIRIRGDEFLVDGRRRPALTASMRRQIDAVQASVASGPMPAVPVTGLFCFVDANLPLGGLVVDGVDATNVRGTRKRLKVAGPLAPDERATLHAYLSGAFPPA